jgi:hypothetical protein
MATVQNNGIADAARLSVAPMMDKVDCCCKSNV